MAAAAAAKLKRSTGASACAFSVARPAMEKRDVTWVTMLLALGGALLVLLPLPWASRHAPLHVDAENESGARSIASIESGKGVR